MSSVRAWYMIMACLSKVCRSEITGEKKLSALVRDTRKEPLIYRQERKTKETIKVYVPEDERKNTIRTPAPCFDNPLENTAPIHSTPEQIRNRLFYCMLLQKIGKHCQLLHLKCTAST